MFGEFIKASGKAQAAWAEVLTVSPGYLSDLISGKKCPSLHLAVRIERVTGGAVPAASWVPPEADAAAPAPQKDTAA